MRKFLTLITLMFLTASAAFAADWAPVVRDATPKVPRLEMQRDGNRGVCSGATFLIDADGWAYSLTAAHCVNHNPSERFDLTVNGRHASPVDFNNLLDLAIVKYRAHKEEVMTFAAASPSAGAEVSVIGYAFGVEDLVAQFGHVAQPFNKESKSIWIDAMTIFGDSGGAIIDAEGHLVGITSQIFAGQNQAAHIGAAVPIDSVKDFVDDFTQKLKKEKK